MRNMRNWNFTTHNINVVMAVRDYCAKHKLTPTIAKGMFGWSVIIYCSEQDAENIDEIIEEHTPQILHSEWLY